MFIGDALVIASAGIMLKESGHSELEIGAISAFFFLGAIFSGFFVPSIIGALSYVRAYAVFTALFGIAAMLHDLGSNLVYWAILRFILGFCYYALLMIIESWLNARARNEVRSRVLAFYEITFYVCFGLGILVLSLNLSTSHVLLLSAAFILFSSIPLNLIRIKEPPIPEKKSVSIPRVFALVPLALITSIVAGILINGFFTMASVYILLQGYGAKEVSFFMTVAMAGGFIAHSLIGGFSDKFGRRPAIMCCAGVSLFAAICFLALKPSIYAQYVLSFFLGSGAFCLYALSLARANDVLKHKNQGIEVGRAVLFSYSFGSLLSSVIMGASMQILGFDGFMWVYVALLAFLIAFCFTQKTVPLESRSDFEHSPGTMANS